jgi:integrase
MRSLKRERVVRRVLKSGEIREYRYIKDAPRSRFADDSVAALVAAYKLSPDYARLSDSTKSSKGYYLRHIEKLGDKPVMEVSRGDWYDLRDAIAAISGTGAATVFQKVVSALLNWATERGKITHNVMAGAKQLEGGHLPAWSAAQADEACSKLPEVLRRVVVLARYTGQRRGDLCAMMWSAYDGSSLKVKQQKTGASLVVPVHPVLKAELDNWRRAAQSTHILVSETGKPWKPGNLTALMGDWLERIGLPGDLNVHGLRKLAAASLADAGCTTHEIAAITGHRSLAMVELYTKSANQARLAEAAIIRLANKTENGEKSGTSH